ncbi:hypothetical protein M5K25_011110 [Dendrobium thyrsiflorum]|uniref:Maturase K n=1 Tax=Dendrobium thyrsiflorum TaxID=117978 RepID=A0ABD0V908_DENTH
MAAGPSSVVQSPWGVHPLALGASLKGLFLEENAIADSLAKMECNLSSFTEFFDHFLPREIKGLARLDRFSLPYIHVK